MSGQFPEMINALQLAGLYCSQNWDAFEEWLRDLGGLEEEEHLSREFMAASVKDMDVLLREAEIRFLSARLDGDMCP